VRSRYGSGKRPWTFYVLAMFFTLFVLFLYGPMGAIYLLSFQGPNGGLTFPMHGVSLQWFAALFVQHRTGDVAGALLRSSLLAILVLGMTVVLSVMAGLALRRRFVGATLVFYLTIASLIMPGLLVGLGIGLMCQLLSLQPAWYTSALGAQLTWTLPFGLLIMFAGSAASPGCMRRPRVTSGRQHGKPVRMSCCPSCCLASLPWRYSALRCPTTSLRAPC
jgi:putative spermidine/putrescine transport system permease protein